MFGYLSGRTNRKFFWTGFVCAAVVVAISAWFVEPERLSIPVTVIWFMLCGRRLHDFGRSMFWTLIPILISLGLGVYGVWQLRAPLTIHEGAQIKEVLPLIQQKEELMLALLAAGGGVQIIYTIVIGFIRGDAGENRFGPKT